MNIRIFLRGVTLGSLTLFMACGRVDHIGKAPSFSPNTENQEHSAMLWPGLPMYSQPQRNVDQSSLWSGERRSLLGDRRAVTKGDILTIVIQIDEKAEISNDTARSRSGSESLGIPQLFGVPQRINEKLPPGATMADAVGIDSSSASVPTLLIRAELCADVVPMGNCQPSQLRAGTPSSFRAIANK